MNPKRNRYGPATFLMVAALFLFALLVGTPGVQREEVDTGPTIVLELVSHPAEADVLDAYCFESELVDVDIKTALVSPTEDTRYESGQRSGVVRRSSAITCFDDDLMNARHGSTPYPLRC
jgi:hypothetical protein